MIKSSFDFALFILLGEYYDSMNVSLTPILDSLVVSNSYRFGLSVNTYHIPHESDRQQVGTTNQINIVYWRPPSPIDNPCLLACLLSSLDLIKSNVRLLDEVGRVGEKYFGSDGSHVFRDRKQVWPVVVVANPI